MCPACASISSPGPYLESPSQIARSSAERDSRPIRYPTRICAHETTLERHSETKLAPQVKDFSYNHSKNGVCGNYISAFRLKPISFHASFPFFFATRVLASNRPNIRSQDRQTQAFLVTNLVQALSNAFVRIAHHPDTMQFALSIGPSGA